MRLPIGRHSSRLPKYFPVDTVYVVEGHSDEDGGLRVSARYVMLPDGRRINVPARLPGAAPARTQRRWRASSLRAFRSLRSP